MFCVYCGEVLEEDENFCHNCGKPVIRPVSAVQETSAIREQGDVSGNGYGQGRNVYGQSTAYEQQGSGNGQGPRNADGLDEYYGCYEGEQENSGSINGRGKQKKKKTPSDGGKRHLLPVILIVAMAAAAVFCVYFLFLRNAGTDDLEKVAENTVQALADRTEYGETLYNISQADEKGVRVTVEDIGQLMDGLGGDYASGAGYVNGDMNVTVATDKDGNSSAYAEGSCMGFDMSAGVFYTEGGDGDVVVDVPSALGETYGVSLSNLDDRLADSIFAADSGTAYALDSYTCDELESYAAALNGLSEMLSGNMYDNLTEALEEHGFQPEYEKSSESVTFEDGESVNCKKYTAELTPEDIGNALEGAAEWMAPLMGDEAENMRSELSYISGSAESEDVTGEFVYYVYKNCLVKAVISFESPEESGSGTGTVEFECGPDPAEADTLILSCSEENEEEFRINADFSSLEDQGAVTIEYYTYGDETPDWGVTVEYDSDTSSFLLSADNYGDSYVLNGTMEVNDSALMLSDIAFEATGNTAVSLNGVSAEVGTEIRVQKVSEMYPSGYKDMLDLSVSEMDALLQSVQSFVNAFG